ncbi:iron complex outermembrane receptor protein [Sinobacterium caligoides]|uniref:Iron complex outermembrane receptor protein n=1 Tax=Sinobacterium caligoides TaxID=933926 RepID=A0A3N2DNZ3_9GAMM|nr:TonB-dependent receptor [Sinobacterium caligoides]ROS01486.1 iron complex outermembrane receptor protein [Sinobacterium caligoides]
MISTRKQHLSTGFYFAALPLAIAAALPVSANANSGEEVVLEELIVTARKRVENVQEIPIAVSAFSADKLNEGGITNLANFGDRVPNIELENGNGSTGDANVYIRGVGQRETKSNLDSGVGIYLDGVYIPRASGALLDLNDVESVQILRGPQGTLFGKNTTGGALVITTNKPDDQLGGTAMLRAGNYDRLDFQGTINAPLIEDKLLSRVTYSSINRDGTTENVYDGKDYNDESRQAVQVQLRWLNSETITTDFNFTYTKTDQRSRGGPCVYSGTTPGSSPQEQSLLLINNGPTPQGLAPGITADGQAMNLYDACNQSSGDALDDWQFASDAVGGYNTSAFGASATVEWEVNDNLTFRSISAYRSLDEKVRDQELDFTSLPILSRHNTAPTTNQYISQELQLIGDLFDNKVQYVTGVFAFKEQGKENYNSTTGPSFGNYLLNPNDGSLTDINAIPGLENANAMLLLDAETRLKTDHLGGAIFGQADWRITENLTLTAGARYTYEQRKLALSKSSPNVTDFGMFVQDMNTFNPAIPANLIYIDPLGSGFNTDNYGYGTDAYQVKDSITDHAVTPMASIQYAFSEEGLAGLHIDAANTYLSASKGFRAGGLNEGVDQDLLDFDPETVVNLEWGLKIDALDRRLRANLAVFHMSYDDIQLTSIRTGGGGRPAPITINAAGAQLQGVELELTAIPFANFEVSYSGAFLDGEYDDFNDLDSSGQAIDRSHEDMVRAPNYNHFLSAQYFIHSALGTFVPRVEVQRKGETAYHLTAEGWDSGLWNSGSATIYNARLSWSNIDDDLMVTLYGRNLGNTYYVTGGTDVTNMLNVGNLTYGDPRTYGVEAHYSF